MKEQEMYRQEQFGIREQPFAGRVYAGENVLWLPKSVRNVFAEQVSSKLAEKKNTMLQWTPEQLVESMQEKRAAVVTAPGNPAELLAFAQVWEYPYDLFSYIPYSAGFGDRERKVLEVGTWLSFGPRGTGIGFRVFQEAMRAGRKFDPEAMQIGIIEQGNSRAQHVMKNLGGYKIGDKLSPVVKTAHGDPAVMNIYLLPTAV